MMNKNNKGIAHILVLILVIVAIVTGVLWYFYQNQTGVSYLTKDGKMMMEEEAMLEDTSNPPSAEPVSTDDSMETIEAELDATITGSPETELDALNEDASSL